MGGRYTGTARFLRLEKRGEICYTIPIPRKGVLHNEI